MFKFRALGLAGLMVSLPLGILPGCDKEVAFEDGGTDAGLPDAGNQDAGVIADAGPTDAGADAGSDAGPDAGPVIGSIDFINVPTPVGLSANGATALLQNFGAVVDVYLYDTASKTLTHKTTTGDDPAVAGQEAVYGLSGDGTTIIGIHGAPAQAALWSEAKGWQDLGSPFDAGCDPNASGGWGLNDDATVAVGLVWDVCVADAFRWTSSSDAGAFTVLDKVGGGPGGSDRASVVSADGKVTAGFTATSMLDRTPIIWQVDGTGVMLDTVQAAPGEVLAINADGTMVAGIVNLDGFYWTQADGLVDIGKLPNALPTDTAFQNAIAAGGTLIFGGCGDAFGGIVQATVWTKTGGLQTLQDIAVAQGVVIPDGYILSTIMAASQDGTILLGWGLDSQGLISSYVLRMPVSAYGITSP